MTFEKTSDSLFVTFGDATGPYGWTSNFFEAKFHLDGQDWLSTEHYVQAQKFLGTPKFARIRGTKSAEDARKVGNERDTKLRDDWETVKEMVMVKCNQAKFEQNAELKRHLLATHPLRIVFRGADTWWANAADGKGLNKMGEILGQLRHDLALLDRCTRPIHVFRSVVIAAPVEVVWSRIRVFDDISWSPGAACTSQIAAHHGWNVVGENRVITLKTPAGEKRIVERLLSHSDVDRSYSYRIEKTDAGIFPGDFSKYSGHIRLVEITDSNTTLAVWTADFLADPATALATEGAVGDGIFVGALRHLNASLSASLSTHPTPAAPAAAAKTH